MKNFTLKMLSLLFLGFIGINANSQEWNFSSATLSALGTISATKTVEGLTIVATADAVVAVDANNKSLDGMDFTSRIKLGGSGAFDAEGKPVSRVLSFPVSGSAKITVMGMSSSSTADRQLIIAAGLKDNIVGTFPALGTPITKGEYTYTGGPTTIYLYSPSSGVNLYYIKNTPLVVGIQSQKLQDLKVYPNPAKGRVYLGVSETSQVGIFSITGKLLKQQQVNQSQNSFDISDLRAGIYFIRMMDNISNAQKLIVR